MQQTIAKSCVNFYSHISKSARLSGDFFQDSEKKHFLKISIQKICRPKQHPTTTNTDFNLASDTDVASSSGRERKNNLLPFLLQSLGAVLRTTWNLPDVDGAPHNIRCLHSNAALGAPSMCRRPLAAERKMQAPAGATPRSLWPETEHARSYGTAASAAGKFCCVT